MFEKRGDKIRIISNRHGLGMYNVLPNNFVCFGDDFSFR